MENCHEHDQLGPANLTVQTHSGLRWADIKRQLTGWRHLEGLDDRGLEDIGISSGSGPPISSPGNRGNGNGEVFAFFVLGCAFTVGVLGMVETHH